MTRFWNTWFWNNLDSGMGFLQTGLNFYCINSLDSGIPFAADQQVFQNRGFTVSFVQKNKNLKMPWQASRSLLRQNAWMFEFSTTVRTLHLYFRTYRMFAWKRLISQRVISIKVFFNFLCIYFIIPCTLVHYHFLRTWAKSSSVLRQIQPWLSQFSRNKATTPFCQTDRLRLLGGRRMHTGPKLCIFRLEFIVR